MSKLQAAEQLRKAIQLFALSLSEDQALAISTVYEPWNAEKTYSAGEYLTYGKNGVGDPQLYKVVQSHTSQGHWLPDQTPALYTPIGLDAAGYPIWVQPVGAHDAYSKGDIVNCNGVLYRSTIDGNVYPPDAHSMWWEAFSE